MLTELQNVKSNENLSLLEQLVYISYLKFSKPALLFSDVMLSEISWLNKGRYREAGWLEEGMKGLEKIVVQGLRE